MLYRIVGLEICVLLFIPMALIYRYNEKRRGTLVKYKMSLFTVVYAACSLLFVFTVFPLVIQRNAPAHNMIYLNPLGRIIREFESVNLGFGMDYFIFHNIVYFGASFVVYAIFGFAAAMVFQKRKGFAAICIASIFIEAWYILWGLALGSINRYKSISTEDILLFILFGSIGIWLYGKLMRISGRYAKKSDILNWMYHVLLLTRRGGSGKGKNYGGALSELHTDD